MALVETAAEWALTPTMNAYATYLLYVEVKSVICTNLGCKRPLVQSSLATFSASVLIIETTHFYHDLFFYQLQKQSKLTHRVSHDEDRPPIHGIFTLLDALCRS